ncbi:hypothetical protein YASMINEVIRUS_1234 [Yasminevirus sp. GU-2018]|uniref:Transposase IS4-like domain-containing protein n=1 Tax=Yasminevirus sp. GU-2018 TaxID=2420051 RepID=A0A5K0UAX9_9VIRU|nr:hypothetical protein YASMINEVIRUS_1234 [Yasminevirus sp. GU-2018]
MKRSETELLELDCKAYKQYVLEAVDEECPFKKKSKYNYDYYYDMMHIVLKDVVSWRSLKVTKNYGDKKEHHHTTIRKMFNKWSSKNVFKIAYDKMMDKMLENVNKKNSKKVKNMFIDSTFIANKTGSELVGVNPMNYKKRVTKLSIVCDDSKNVVNIKEFKSTTNDCITIEKTLEGVRLKGRVNLIGDKGYHVRKEVKEALRKRRIRLIVPRRKNQKKRYLRSKDRELLKERNKIENVIKMLKSINRISVRKDKRISNYLGFVWVGCGIKMYENNKIR